MVDIFNKNIVNAGSDEKGVYIQNGSFIDICGSQADANAFYIRAIDKGMTVDEAKAAYSHTMEENWLKRQESGDIYKKGNRHSVEDQEELEDRTHLWDE